MAEEPHILVVDDHRDIREPLARYLQRHNMRTSLAASAAEARKVMETAAIDLVVLDIMMPGEDGLSLLRGLRHAGDVPVILLTAVTESADRILGLELGADVYVTKPFEPRELVARIRAVLRRGERSGTTVSIEDSEEIRFDRWRLRPLRRELIGEDGVALPLGNAEYRLLTVFLEHPRRVLTRDQLLDLASGRSAQPFDRSIDNRVSRLRRKLERDPKNPDLITTVWGGGYMFTAQVEQP
ncbi:MAG: response regulator [Rhodospirillales bacterium]